MIISVDYARQLADKALARIEASPGCAVVLEGSIAEGFGNPSSDIDFLLVTDDDADTPTMPTLLFLDGRRVEVRTRSVGQLTAQIELVRRRGAQRVSALSEDVLNRSQRLLGSVVLRGEPLMARVKELLPAEEFAGIVSRWWAHHARQSLRQAIALDALDEPDESGSWVRAALVQAVKSWAAGRGETYFEPKWLSMQLDRAGDGAVAQRYWALADPSLDTGNWLAAGIRFASELGIGRACGGPGDISIDSAPGVTTWQVADRVHVVRARRDVFALGAQAALVWRSIVFGRSIPDTMAAVRATGVARAGALVADFLRLGLIRLACRGVTVAPVLPLKAPSGPISPPPSEVRPPVRLAGAVTEDERSIALMPMPADRFSAAAMTLIWSNVVVENAREDLRGAVAAGQWRVAELSAHRVVLACARSLLSAYGVNPLPPDSDVVRQLSLLPDDLDPIRELATTLSTRRVAHAASADAVLTELEHLVSATRNAAGSPAFPASFDTARAWDDTLAIGYDWLRLGAYLDADLPIDEARDLLTSGGAQPHATG